MELVPHDGPPKYVQTAARELVDLGTEGREKGAVASPAKRGEARERAGAPPRNDRLMHEKLDAPLFRFSAFLDAPLQIYFDDLRPGRGKG